MSGASPPARRERRPLRAGTLRLAIQPIDSPASFKNKAYLALKNVIAGLDIYRSRTDIRLDERQLAHDFGAQVGIGQHPQSFGRNQRAQPLHSRLDERRLAYHAQHLLGPVAPA